jgi:hypothetical protein
MLGEESLLLPLFVISFGIETRPALYGVLRGGESTAPFKKYEATHRCKLTWFLQK